jgi:mycofactocin precursor
LYNYYEVMPFTKKSKTDERQVMMKIEPKTVVASPIQNESTTMPEEPQVLEEIVVEELSIDGICGVY